MTTKALAQACLEGRADGDGPCGACVICCQEQIARAEAAESTLAEVTAERDRAQAQLVAIAEEGTDEIRAAVRLRQALAATRAKLAAAEAEGVRLREALEQFASCDLNEDNCANLDVATRRIRAVARAVLKEQP